MIVAVDKSSTDSFTGLLVICWLIWSAWITFVGVEDKRDSLVWLGGIMFFLYIVYRIGAIRGWFP